MSEKKNVLIIDDSQEILGLLHYEMKINKMSASEVDTVDKAIKELNQTKYDYIILDIFLKEGSSEGVIKELKTPSNLNYDTPIILISGMINNDFIERNQNKVAKIIMKPFKRGDISNAINELEI